MNYVRIILMWPNLFSPIYTMIFPFLIFLSRFLFLSLRSTNSEQKYFKNQFFPLQCWYHFNWKPLSTVLFCDQQLLPTEIEWGFFKTSPSKNKISTYLFHPWAEEFFKDGHFPNHPSSQILLLATPWENSLSLLQWSVVSQLSSKR